MKLLDRFLVEESGQDLIEYTLLLAFVALVSAAIFIQAGKSAAGIGHRQPQLAPLTPLPRSIVRICVRAISGRVRRKVQDRPKGLRKRQV